MSDGTSGTDGQPNADALDDAMDRLANAFAAMLGAIERIPPEQTNDEAEAEYLAARTALRVLVGG